MGASTGIGRNSVSKHQIQREYGDEQADAGRDCQTLLATKFSGANGDSWNILIFPVQLTTSRIGSLTQLILMLTIFDVICGDHTVCDYFNFTFSNVSLFFLARYHSFIIMFASSGHGAASPISPNG